MSLIFGTAPDSWGVWFARDESQPAWDRFLDEVVASGYRWIELGPYGYLPTDEGRLRHELESRDLKVIAGTLEWQLSWPLDRALAEVDRVAGSTASQGGRFVVVFPSAYRSGGAVSGPRELQGDRWRDLVDTTNLLGRHVRETHGLTLTFHPHADTVVEYPAQVERFLEDTDAENVALCLDTGHVEYRGGDAVALMRGHHRRIPYLHLKTVQPELRERIQHEDLDFPTAVRLGAMCEPGEGTVDFPALAGVLDELGEQRWAIVEQDMYPLDDLDRPLPIAVRTREAFERLGWRADVERVAAHS